MTQDSFIASFTVEDLRFPTSLTGDGTDANNRECDYSAAYCTLRTNLGEVGLVGVPAHWLRFDTHSPLPLAQIRLDLHHWTRK